MDAQAGKIVKRVDDADGEFLERPLPQHRNERRPAGTIL